MATTVERPQAAQRTKKINDLVIMLAGEGGEGVVGSGMMIGDAFVRYNLKIFTFRTFPAEIKGGTVMYQVRTNENTIRSPGDVIDAFVGFTQEGYEKFGGELPSDGYLLVDSDEVKSVHDRFQHVYKVPMGALARETGKAITKTTVGVGAIAAMLNMDLDVYEDLLRKRFAGKAKKEIAELKKAGEYVEGMEAPIVEVNLKALHLGYDYVKNLEEELHDLCPLVIEPRPGETKMNGNGNRMITLGSIAAGCNVYAGYPITPASDIMEEMAKFLPRFGGSVLQTEDEIAALGVAIGAGYTGAKAMTATSGPGLSLMVELLGLAAMLECPVVIVDAQRAGPSTGMPTKTEQSDLYLAAYAGHGDFPRFVLAPATVTDCFWIMVKAFNLAEKYQSPVIVLTDQNLAGRIESIDRPDLSRIDTEYRIQPTAEQLARYSRHEITEDGISPFAIPGTEGGMFFTTGLEHNERGEIKHEPWVHREMSEKRFRKFRTAMEAGDLDSVELYGDADAELGIIGWGSNKGVIEEAIDMAHEIGLKVGFINPTVLFPVNTLELEPYFKQWKKILVPECNYAGQYLTLLRDAFPGYTNFESMVKYTGFPFTPSEIFDAIKEHSHGR